MQDKRILRSHGYSLKGQRAKVKRRYSPWGPRITAIPVISYNEGLLDVGLYKGHVNGETFLDFVNDVLTPCLLPFNGYNPRSIVILGKVSFQQTFQQLPTVPHRLYLIFNFPTILADNAAIHHTREVVDAINATGALLIFLPPYSPDLMPCEELFSQSKNYIRQNDIAWQDSPDPELMVLDSFLQVTDENIRNYIRHAEYA